MTVVTDCSVSKQILYFLFVSIVYRPMQTHKHVKLIHTQTHKLNRVPTHPE